MFFKLLLTQSVITHLLHLVRHVSSYEFSGDGTFYGGANSGGSCSSSYTPRNFITVAMNKDQYRDGLSCGTCLEAVLHEASGPRNFKAIVDNLCPECVHGDLDIGESGDGRWDITWSFIDCPEEELIVTTQGSNSFYGKIKIEAGGGVKSVTVNDQDTYSTPDGFWVVEDSTGKLGCGPKTAIVFDSNTEEVLCVDGNLFGGDCPSNSLCKINGGTGNTVKPTDKPVPTTVKPTPEPTGQISTPEPERDHEGPELSLECKGEWTQCNREDGSFHCCQTPLECTFINKDFSYCTLPDTGHCQSRWEQCGGKGWNGLTCCNLGATCIYRNEWHSQCL